MYKVAYISGSAFSIEHLLKMTIDNINNSGGHIQNIVQSQSTNSNNGITNVTITIIYTLPGALAQSRGLF